MVEGNQGGPPAPPYHETPRTPLPRKATSEFMVEGMDSPAKFGPPANICIVEQVRMPTRACLVVSVRGSGGGPLVQRINTTLKSVKVPTVTQDQIRHTRRYFKTRAEQRALHGPVWATHGPPLGPLGGPELGHPGDHFGDQIGDQT